MGAYDYLMIQTANESYLAKFEPAQLEYFSNFPTWFVVFLVALGLWLYARAMQGRGVIM